MRLGRAKALLHAIYPYQVKCKHEEDKQLRTSICQFLAKLRTNTSLFRSMYYKTFKIFYFFNFIIIS